MENISKSQKNAITFENEFLWLSNKIDYRLNHFFKVENSGNTSLITTPPNLENDTSDFALFLKKTIVEDTERLILITALASQFITTCAQGAEKKSM